MLVSVRKSCLLNEVRERIHVGYAPNLFSGFNVLAHRFFFGGLPFLGRGFVFLLDDVPLLFLPFHFRVTVVVTVCVAGITDSCSAIHRYTDRHLQYRYLLRQRVAL